MKDIVHKAIAVVGVGAVLPDAPDAPTFWENVKAGRYSITETPKDRWDPDLYFDEDPSAPDKTYSKIGGWVRDFEFDPFSWRLPIPPKVADAMDRTQKWSIMATREALVDYGFPDREMDFDRTAVILGNAMAGDQHYMTALRIMFPEYAVELANSPAFASLPPELSRRRSPTSCWRVSGDVSLRSPRTPCRESWATSLPGALPTSLISTGPTTSWTPPAPRRWQP